ncbi:MAG: LPXTG cell wall anchor domain-containing protein [Pseudomonadota bacterium]
MKNALLSATAGLAALVGAQAHASLTIFTDRDAFVAALGGSLVEENFEGLLIDTYFADQAVHFDGFSVGYSGILRGPLFNLIDTGTPVAVNNPFNSNALVGTVLPNEVVEIAFTSSVHAFGGNWARINDSAQRSVFEVAGQTVNPGIDLDGFFGVLSDDPFDTFRVAGVALSEGFGLDDALFANLDPTDSSEVPVPAAGLLFAGGLATWFSRKRKKA